MYQISLDEMCRICGENATSSFETFQDHRTYICKYLPIKDDDNNGFPKSVCLLCLSLVADWNTFYSRCEETQKRFALLLNVKTGGNSSESMTDNSVNKEVTNGLRSLEGKRKPTSQRVTVLSCNFCTVKPTNQKQLNDHLIAAHCDLVFCCDICNCYKPREDLLTHMTEHAANVSKPSPRKTLKKSEKFECPECGKKFNSISGLKYHMNAMHIATQQFPCEECGNIFTSRRVLINHIRSIHRKDKQFECTICKKCFKTDSTLYAHRKTHLNKTRYKCLYCQKGFNFKHHLDIHLLQHNLTDKTFECNSCQKKFAALNNLTKHQKIHDNKVDYTCHICGVKTLQKRYLRDHIKRVHQKWLNDLETPQ